MGVSTYAQALGSGFESQDPCKKARCGLLRACNSITGRGGDGKIDGLAHHQPNSRSNEGPCLRGIRCKVIEQNLASSCCGLCAHKKQTHSHRQNHTHTHICTPTYANITLIHNYMHTHTHLYHTHKYTHISIHTYTIHTHIPYSNTYAYSHAHICIHTKELNLTNERKALPLMALSCHPTKETRARKWSP